MLGVHSHRVEAHSIMECVHCCLYLHTGLYWNEEGKLNYLAYTLANISLISPSTWLWFIIGSYIYPISNKPSSICKVLCMWRLINKCRQHDPATRGLGFCCHILPSSLKVQERCWCQEISVQERCISEEMHPFWEMNGCKEGHADNWGRCLPLLYLLLMKLIYTEDILTFVKLHTTTKNKTVGILRG